MKSTWLKILGAMIGVFLLAQAVNYFDKSFSKTQKIGLKDYSLSGPYTYKNLSIFVVHGGDEIAGDNFYTLEEALKEKKLVVLETSTVSELKVKNLSKDWYVFMQSGDILKGGMQDRVVQHDTIVPPDTNDMAIDSFCVEAGRWERRGNEEVQEFKSSENMIASKKMKLAVRQKKSQSEVWKEVSETQEKIGKNLNKSIQSNVSESSLELSLEDKDLQKKMLAYVDELKDISNQKSAIGFVSVINGKIHTADIYSNKIIFQKVWNKMLKASVVEAIGEKEEIKSNKLTQSEIGEWLKNAESGKIKKEETKNADLDVQETPSTIVHKSYDKANKKKWYRKSYTSH